MTEVRGCPAYPLSAGVAAPLLSLPVSRTFPRSTVTHDVRTVQNLHLHCRAPPPEGLPSGKIVSMPDPRRKLAAIMFTDIVGYSRLISADENRGLALLAEHDKIVLGVVAEHDGNVLKQMGDAVFAEFSSSIGAVNCAVAIQEALKDLNENKSNDERILIRIGLHLGDVSVQGDDLFGEGINVAARLEPLAAPGGICMSQAVYQSVISHTNISAILVGEVELKNIIEKYTIYKVPSFYEEYQDDSSSGGEEDTALLDFEIKSVETMPPPSRSYWKMVSLLLFFLLLNLVGGFIIGLNRNRGTDIPHSEVMDMKSLILKLQDDDSPVSRELRNRLDSETAAMIDRFVATDSVIDELSNGVRRSLTRVIRNGTLIFGPEIIAPLNISHEIDELIRMKPQGKKLSRLNRLLMGRAFSDEIQEVPNSFIRSIASIPNKLKASPVPPSVRWTILLLLLLNILVMFSGAYGIALTTRRVRFRDVREVDQLLGYFTEQMGFKEPVKIKGLLVFKPTRARLIKDILAGFPASIRARVDGNSAVITSTIPYVKRLMKQLQAYSS